VFNATYTPVVGTKKCSVNATLTHNPYCNVLSTIPSELPPFIPFYRYFAFLVLFFVCLANNLGAVVL